MVVGMLALLVSLVPPCPCAEPVRSAVDHDCCTPPLGVRAPDQMCCSSPRDASLVGSVPSSPIAAPAPIAFAPVDAESVAVPAPLAAARPRPASSPPSVLRI
jgi:hypothetical protein